MRNPKAINQVFRALGQLAKGSGAQAGFSSVPLVSGYNEERCRKSQQIQEDLAVGLVSSAEFGVFRLRVDLHDTGLLGTNGMHLSQRRQELALSPGAGLSRSH